MNSRWLGIGREFERHDGTLGWRVIESSRPVDPRYAPPNEPEPQPAEVLELRHLTALEYPSFLLGQARTVVAYVNYIEGPSLSISTVT